MLLRMDQDPRLCCNIKMMRSKQTLQAAMFNTHLPGGSELGKRISQTQFED